MPSPILRATRKTARHSRASAPSWSGVSAGRVLLADPCPDTIETMAWLLRFWGYAVEAVASGPEALEAALADRPDVVLLELALPKLDGLQVARQLRRSAGGPSLLLVAISGYGSEKDRARTREAGFDCHFVKPVCPDALRAWLVSNCVYMGEN
jgi:two-component system, sensor histidine kinase